VDVKKMSRLDFLATKVGPPAVLSRLLPMIMGFEPTLLFTKVRPGKKNKGIILNKHLFGKKLRIKKK